MQKLAESCQHFEKQLSAPTPHQELSFVAVEAHGWQSAGITARLPSPAAALDAALAWTMRGRGAFVQFNSHPDDGMFFPAWPEAVLLGATPCLGQLGASDAAAAAALLRSYRLGVGLGQSGSSLRVRCLAALMRRVHICGACLAASFKPCAALAQACQRCA